MRLFIAIALSDQVKEELYHLQDTLIFSDLDCRRVQKNTMHLTLAFLGETKEDLVDQLKKKLAAISFAPIDTALKCIGVFPDTPPARVIWAGLENEEKLRRFADQIRAALKEFGFEEDHPFTSHITLVRVKNATDEAALQERIKNAKINPLPFKITNFALIESKLTKHGPVYLTVAEYGAKNSNVYKQPPSLFIL